MALVQKPISPRKWEKNGLFHQRKPFLVGVQEQLERVRGMVSQSMFQQFVKYDSKRTNLSRMRAFKSLNALYPPITTYKKKFERLWQLQALRRIYDRIQFEDQVYKGGNYRFYELREKFIQKYAFSTSVDEAIEKFGRYLYGFHKKIYASYSKLILTRLTIDFQNNQTEQLGKYELKLLLLALKAKIKHFTFSQKNFSTLDVFHLNQIFSHITKKNCTESISFELSNIQYNTQEENIQNSSHQDLSKTPQHINVTLKSVSISGMPTYSQNPWLYEQLNKCTALERFKFKFKKDGLDNQTWNNLHEIISQKPIIRALSLAVEGEMDISDQQFLSIENLIRPELESFVFRYQINLKIKISSFFQIFEKLTNCHKLKRFSFESLNEKFSIQPSKDRILQLLSQIPSLKQIELDLPPISQKQLDEKTIKKYLDDESHEKKAPTVSFESIDVFNLLKLKTFKNEDDYQEWRTKQFQQINHPTLGINESKTDACLTLDYPERTQQERRIYFSFCYKQISLRFQDLPKLISLTIIIPEISDFLHADFPALFCNNKIQEFSVLLRETSPNQNSFFYKENFTTKRLSKFQSLASALKDAKGIKKLNLCGDCFCTESSLELKNFMTNTVIYHRQTQKKLGTEFNLIQDKKPNRHIFYQSLFDSSSFPPNLEELSICLKEGTNYCMQTIFKIIPTSFKRIKCLKSLTIINMLNQELRQILALRLLGSIGDIKGLQKLQYEAFSIDKEDFVAIQKGVGQFLEKISLKCTILIFEKDAEFVSELSKLLNKNLNIQVDAIISQLQSNYEELEQLVSQYSKNLSVKIHQFDHEQIYRDSMVNKENIDITLMKKYIKNPLNSELKNKVQNMELFRIKDEKLYMGRAKNSRQYMILVLSQNEELSQHCVDELRTLHYQLEKVEKENVGDEEDEKELPYEGGFIFKPSEGQLKFEEYLKGKITNEEQ